MKFPKPFLALASIVVVIGLCIGVVIAFWLTCTGDLCAFSGTGSAQGQSSSAQASSSQSTEESAGEVNIIVTAPQENDVVGWNFQVTGEARVFENVVSYRLRDADGSVLAESVTEAKSPDVGQFGPFVISVDASAAKGKRGTLEVFQSSAKDASEIDKVTVHVVFSK